MADVSVTRSATPSTPRGRQRPTPAAATRRQSPRAAATIQVGHLEHILLVPPAIVRGFANAVSDSLVAGVLPYSDRERLLRRAARLGIGRFDANLIIASVQHRCGGDRPCQGGESRPGFDPERGRDAPMRWRSILFAVLGTQLAVAAVAVIGWMLLRAP